jgi:hypothetical protein
LPLHPVPPLACPDPDPDKHKTFTDRFGAFLELRIQHLWMLAEVGRLRLATPNRINTQELPGGAGVNQAQLLVENEGYTARYVRVMARPGSGALTTFSGSQAGLDPSTAFSFNLGVAESFVEFILLPSERLFAQNQGAANFSTIVFEVDIPLKIL